METQRIEHVSDEHRRKKVPCIRAILCYCLESLTASRKPNKGEQIEFYIAPPGMKLGPNNAKFWISDLVKRNPKMGMVLTCG